MVLPAERQPRRERTERGIWMAVDAPWTTEKQLVEQVKNPRANAGYTRDMGSIPGWGRSPGALE